MNKIVKQQDGKEFSGWISAAKDFFGLLPGEALKDFAAEWKMLTPGDQQEIIAGLRANGYIDS